MALRDREGFLKKAGIEKWRGVGIFPLESGLEWTDGAKGTFCEWYSAGSFHQKGVTDSGMVFWAERG